jgi:spore germination cell wall hydrolase CwlJ-like protein
MTLSIAAAVLWMTFVDVPFQHKELSCLVQNVYHEAGAEPVRGQVAVAMVTLNRVKSSQFPDTICEVVYQRNSKGCQFSWVCTGKQFVRNAKVDRIYTVVQQTIQKKMWIPELQSALYFHNHTVTPMWANTLPHLATVGGHLFYGTR